MGKWFYGQLLQFSFFTKSLVTEPESNRLVGDTGTDGGRTKEKVIVHEEYVKIWTAFM